MDDRLVGWARAVKSRRAQAARRGHGGATWPVLWLFTDAVRTPDVLAAVRGLPVGLCGVVFRHDGTPGRAALAARVGRLCRERRLALVVAGSGLFVRGSGRHMRGGRGAGWAPHRAVRTASVHGVAELIRARTGGAMVLFLSPAFPTRSHLGAPALGPVRWARMARAQRRSVFALGGVDGQSVRRLPRWTPGAGAIGALLAR